MGKDATCEYFSLHFYRFNPVAGSARQPLSWLWFPIETQQAVSRIFHSNTRIFWIDSPHRRRGPYTVYEARNERFRP